ncbi:DUF554 domain-containing protein [Aedoeadaptatus urinae]|uniref:DUF554 domain-containing protein n=1 Tax=Aedoeadaptatus urinae TaxID=1871017 RepID=UPI00097DFB53|nr:DUF554 domain-containing protein [Peptoniphilus urinae]
MIGVLANTAAVVLLSFLGVYVGNRIPERVQNQILVALALCASLMGIQMGMEADEFIVVIVSLALGTGLGAAWDIDGGLARLGEKIDSRFEKPGEDTGGPMAAAIQASLLFCVGSMAIVGSLQAGISGNNDTLFVKSVLDGLTALVMAAALGIGVGFSALPLLLYQGALVLLAGAIAPYISDALVADLTSAGGIMVFAIGLGIMDIKKIPVANMLPAFVVVIVLRSAMGLFM